eukprot:jgi/Hompol1/5442/HPOL_001936-RA
MSLLSLLSPSAPNTDTIFTVEADVPAVEGETKPRRHYKTCTGPLLDLPPGVTNMFDNLVRTVELHGNRPFLGSRSLINGVVGPYVWLSYSEVLRRVKNLGAGLAQLGVSHSSNVGLFSINRAEWVIGEYACLMLGAVTVPLYDTLGEEAVEYIIGLTECSTIIATSDKAATLLNVANKLKSLKSIIIMDVASEELVERGSSVGIQILSIIDIEFRGSENPIAPTPITKDDVATICFTSGTTGVPKGVVLSHANFLSFCAGARRFAELKQVYDFNSTDSYLSYLPLAHVFERIVQVCLIYVGASVGFYQGDNLKLMDDAVELKPTVFASVPRLYNRIYDKVFSSVKKTGGVGAALFKHAYSVKKENLKYGVATHALWDALVFSKIRATLGGRVKWMLTGAAPISRDVVDFLRICFSTVVNEGYGQSEGTGGSACSILEDCLSEGVVPMPHCEIKLVDVPSLGYTSADKPFARGEICIRGHGIFKHYFKEQEKTDEVLDADGFCHTGDIGQWDHRGRLKVIDRVKHIFKLSQGEYVAPEKVEMVYAKHELVAQVFVYGDSLQSSIVAIIVPDEGSFTDWAAEQGVTGKPFAELCKDPKLAAGVVKVLGQYGRMHDLKGFENVKSVHLEPIPFSPANGLLSPTFKLKRHEAQKMYASQISQMYASHSASA